MSEERRQISDAALAETVRKMRKLRLVDHVPIKNAAPPAVTFLAVMQNGLGGCFQPEAIEYVIKHAVKYYLAAIAKEQADG